MPTTLDHALVAVLVVLFPLRAAVSGVRRLRRAPPEERPRLRRRVYAEAIALQWTLAALALALWLVNARPWSALGLVPRFDPWFFGAVAVTVGMMGAAALQLRRALLDPVALERTFERVTHLEAMMPHAVDELRLFRGLACTAGVCEELLYRGFLIWYLSHGMGTWAAALVSSVVFGIGHLYQGWRGMLGTAAVGLLFAAFYLVSGSLFVPMVLHALVDLHAGELTFAAFRHRARHEAERGVGEARVVELVQRESIRMDAPPAPVGPPAPAPEDPAHGREPGAPAP